MQCPSRSFHDLVDPVTIVGQHIQHIGSPVRAVRGLCVVAKEPDPCRPLFLQEVAQNAPVLRARRTRLAWMMVVEAQRQVQDLVARDRSDESVTRLVGDELNIPRTVECREIAGGKTTA